MRLVQVSSTNDSRTFEALHGHRHKRNCLVRYNTETLAPTDHKAHECIVLACRRRERPKPPCACQNTHLVGHMSRSGSQEGLAIAFAEEHFNNHIHRPPERLSFLNEKVLGCSGVEEHGTTSWGDLVQLFPKQGKTHYEHGAQRNTCKDEKFTKVPELVQYSEQDTYIDCQGLFHMLQTCIDGSDKAMGRKAHLFSVESGLEQDALIGSQLVRMFEAVQNLTEAKQTFCRLLAPDTLSWSAIISAHCNLGEEEQAVSLYFEMHNLGIPPDGYLFVAVLKACSTTVHGKLVHAHAIENGFESSVFVCNALITMYIRCGNLDNAIVVFSRLPEHDVVTWSALISGYTQYGFADEAIELFEGMQVAGIKPSPFTLSCILKACTISLALDYGVQLNSYIVEIGCEFEVVVANTLIKMYCECDDFDSACSLLRRLPNRDVATWNTVITGYGQVGLGQEVVSLLHLMDLDGIQPDKITFICSLKACSCSAALHQGEQIHSYAISCGFEFDVAVGNALIDMYGRCGNVNWALVVFHRMPKRDIVTWSGLISGYALHGLGRQALDTFYCMEVNGLNLSWVTFLSLIKACAGTEDMGCDSEIHAHIIEAGFDENILVASGLIDLYGKHSNLLDSRMVFNRLQRRDVGTWNAMLCAYAQHGLAQTAIDLFWQMQEEALEPDQITMVGIIKACSAVGALEQGLQIHGCIYETGLESNLFVGNTLVDMYSKCGSMDDAQILFERLQKRDIITWNALIAGFTQICDYKGAACCLEGMQGQGLKPDEVTFLCVLSACGRAGLLREGSTHFKSMIENNGILPRLEHFNAMVDILGHLRLFGEAEDLLESIPFRHNLVGWTSLLFSCKMPSDIELSYRSFKHVLRLDQGFAPAYVHMLKMYTKANLWEDAHRVEELKRQVNSWKKPAKAFVEINRQVHQFTVGDKTHPCSDMINAKLKDLSIQLKEDGITAQQVQFFSNEEDKEDLSCGHCERLALAFGLVSTPQGATIRILKNLRVCEDCHNATKIISKVEKREIVLIDAYCVHQFKQGDCSCTN